MNENVGPPAFFSRNCSNVPSRSQRSSTRCSSATWSGSAGTGAKAGSAGIGRMIVAARRFAAPGSGLSACPSRPPCSLDATQTSPARARHRGSRGAAPVGPCARRRRGSRPRAPRSRRRQIQQSPAIAVDPGDAAAPPSSPTMASWRRRRTPLRPRRPTGRAGLERADDAPAHRLDLRRSGRRRLGHRRGSPNVYAGRAVGCERRQPLHARSSGIFFSILDDGGASYDSALIRSAGNSTFSQAIEPAIAVDRSIGRVYVAFTRLDLGLAELHRARPTARRSS